MNQFLDTLLQDFINWAQGISHCRAIVLFGSASRSIRPADQYSDRDLLVYTTEHESDEFIEWMRHYAPTWMVIRERGVKGILWLIVFKGGKSVHLGIDPVDSLQEIVASGEPSFDMKRGYKVLLDKDGLAAQLPPPEPYPPPYEPPSQTDFTECVENFTYGTILIAKQLKRGNLWTVQWANGKERDFVLKMIEWHTHAHDPNVDTWQRGEDMYKWIKPEIWQELHHIIGHFDADDSWRALFASIDLFHKLGRETADQLNYPYPETMIGEAKSYLRNVWAGG